MQAAPICREAEYPFRRQLCERDFRVNENVLNSVVTLFPQRCKKALVSYEKLLPYLLSRFGKNPKEYGFGW